VQCVLRGLHAAPRAPGAAPAHPAPQHSTSAGAQSARPARPGLPGSRDCPAPRTTPRLSGLLLHPCPGSTSAAAAAQVARPHLCAFSGAARGGERQRGRSASPPRPLQRRRLPRLSGTPGGGRSALLLIHKAAATAGDWAAGRCARPSLLAMTHDAVAPRPSGAYFSASAPTRGRLLRGPGIWDSGENPCSVAALLSRSLCGCSTSVPWEKTRFHSSQNFSDSWSKARGAHTSEAAVCPLCRLCTAWSSPEVHP
jgi:hypothetical protein